MREVWLRPNRRALFAGMVLPVLAAAGGVATALAAEAVWLRAIGAANALLAAALHNDRWIWLGRRRSRGWATSRASCEFICGWEGRFACQSS